MINIHRSNFEAIALGFEGALADTASAHMASHVQAYQEIAEEKDMPELGTIDMAIHDEARHHGSDPLTINSWIMAQADIVRTGGGFGIVKAVVNRMTEIYDAKAADGLDAMPGAVKFARFCHETWKGNAFIATEHKGVIPFLGKYGLDQAFGDRILIARSENKNLDYRAEAYMLLLSRLAIQATPERLLVVESTPEGIESARTAGVIVAAVLTPRNKNELLAQTGHRKADVYANNFKFLSAMI